VIPAIDFSEFKVFGVTFHTFGLLVAVGVLLGHQVTVMRARALGLASVGRVDRFVLVVFTGGFLAGHMLDSIFYHPEVLRRDPWELFMLHHGLSSFGGIIGAVLAGLAFVRLHKLNPWVFTDLATYAFPFGWLFGRMGCAMVHDHPGRLTDSALAVRFPGGARFDLGLMEFALTPLLIALVVVVGRRTRRPGMVSGALAVAYPLIRFPLDFLRATDLGAESDPRYAGLTPAQWACMGMLVLGVWMLASARTHDPLPAREAQPAASSPP
jgi:phosphatidylglycerol---prolipoprotein diacylglyceryl transferase